MESNQYGGYHWRQWERISGRDHNRGERVNLPINNRLQNPFSEKQPAPKEERMTDCIFCKIIQGEIPSVKVYEDEIVTAFRDINPIAPTHILIVPNQHISTINDLKPDDEKTMGYLFTIARQIAESEGISTSGYRLIINTGPDGGQIVFHLHLHLLGGRKLRQMG